MPEAFAIIRESMDRHIGIRSIFDPENHFDPDQLDDEMLEAYDEDRISVGVIGSHSALDVCDGAAEEGLHTIAVCERGREAPYARHVYHLFVIRAERRDALQHALAQRGIATGVHYPVPLHLQPAYQHLRLGRGAFPVAERAADVILSLPMFPELTDGQVCRVVEAIRDFFRP